MADKEEVHSNSEITLDEASVLWNYHKGKADYFLACKQTNIKIANKKPLYTFGGNRKYHRQRARYFLSLIEKKE